MPDTDISFVSSGRPSIDRIFPPFYDTIETGRTGPRLSNISEIESNNSFESMQYGRRSADICSPPELSPMSHDSDRLSSASQTMVRACIIFIQSGKCIEVASAISIMNKHI